MSHLFDLNYVQSADGMPVTVILVVRVFSQNSIFHTPQSHLILIGLLKCYLRQVSHSLCCTILIKWDCP